MSEGVNEIHLTSFKKRQKTTFCFANLHLRNGCLLILCQQYAFLFQVAILEMMLQKS